MTCTTFLHSGELNIPLPDKEIQKVLEEVRSVTGKDWQVVPTIFTKQNWFSTQTKTLYGVYVYVGGMGPWQQINFYNAGPSSICLYVPLETVAAYLIGILAGANK